MKEGDSTSAQHNAKTGYTKTLKTHRVITHTTAQRIYKKWKEIRKKLLCINKSDDAWNFPVLHTDTSLMFPKAIIATNIICYLKLSYLIYKKLITLFYIIHGFKLIT